MIFTVDECMSCQAPISPEAGTYYCDKCIVKQEEEAQREAEAFDAFHRWADSVSRGRGSASVWLAVGLAALVPAVLMITLLAAMFSALAGAQ